MLNLNEFSYVYLIKLFFWMRFYKAIISQSTHYDRWSHVVHQTVCSNNELIEKNPHTTIKAKTPAAKYELTTRIKNYLGETSSN